MATSRPYSRFANKSCRARSRCSCRRLFRCQLQRPVPPVVVLPLTVICCAPSGGRSIEVTGSVFDQTRNGPLAVRAGTLGTKSVEHALLRCRRRSVPVRRLCRPWLCCRHLVWLRRHAKSSRIYFRKRLHQACQGASAVLSSCHLARRNCKARFRCNRCRSE